MTKEERKNSFIERAKQLHPDGMIDYSNVVYVNNRTPVHLFDKSLRPDGTPYGDFWQTPSNHLKGQCHPDKRGQRISINKRFDKETVIAKFKKAHPNENLDYSKMVYVNMHTPIEIISHDLRPDGTEYGTFWQEPNAHLRGCTHPDVHKDRGLPQQQSMGLDKFLVRASEVHPNSGYTYEQVKYINNRTKILINCHKCNKKGVEHGLFLISPDNFLQGKGCPKCGNSISTAEDEIYDYLNKNLGITNICRRNRNLLPGYELDLYLPDYNIAIEFNGLRWHSEKFGKDRNYHYNKSQSAYDKGIRLIHVFEDEWLHHKAIVLDKLSHILGFNVNKNRIFARKCIVKNIDKNTADTFLEQYHIQGACRATVRLGLYHNDTLIAVQSFWRHNESEWELVRFATDNKYIISGAGGKLFNSFVRDYKPSTVISFLDRRWSFKPDYNLYTKLGFTLDGIIRPDYKYTSGQGERKHKFGFRKNKLSRQYGFSMNMTEHEMTSKLGLYRIWDCGLIRYMWKAK